MMSFPETVEEFMDSYKIVDTEGIYMSKRAEMVPIFRMKQWFEHISAQPEQKTGKWKYLYDGNYKCSNCGSWWTTEDTPMESGMYFCPNCGARMEGIDDNR